MLAVGPENLLDHIYEAAALPELWPEVLDGVAALGGTLNGVLFATPPQSGSVPAAGVRWISSRSAAETITRWIAEGWTERHLLIERTLKLDRAGFVRDQDLCTPEEIEHEPIYESLRSVGYGWNTGFIVQAPTGDVLTFAWNKAYAAGPIGIETLDLLNPLRSHLARAALMASRLGLERAQAATSALSMLGMPAAVLSPLHRVMAANSPFEALMPHVMQERAMGGLRIRDRRADALFLQALNDAITLPAGAAPPPQTVFSVPLRATEEQPAMVVHILPVRRQARDVFNAAAKIVIVTPVGRGEMPSAGVIRGLFDLTAAEARVARLIGEGRTVREIADQSETSEGTIRAQLKTVFGKTGVSRQTDLASLVASMTVVRR